MVTKLEGKGWGGGFRVAISLVTALHKLDRK